MDLSTGIISFASSIISAGFGAWLSWYLRGKAFKQEKEKFAKIDMIDPKPNELHSRAFYDKQLGLFRSTRQDVYVSGTGIEQETSEGSQIAKEILGAMERCMDRGVKITRIQFDCDNKAWIESVKKLAKKKKKQFSLYLMPPHYQEEQFVQLLVTDPSIASTTCTQILFPEEKHTGVSKQTFAGTAVFIEGNRELSKYVTERILKMSKVPGIEKVGASKT